MKPKYRLDIDTGQGGKTYYWLSAETEGDAQQVLADLENALRTGVPAEIVRYQNDVLMTTYINPSNALSWTIVWRNKEGVWESVSLN